MQSQLIRRSVSCPILNSISSSRGLLCNNSTSLAAVGTGNDAATGTTSPPNSSSQITVRYKHSSRQIKRLFKNNPARLRVEARMGIVRNDNQKKQAPLLNSEEEGENQSSSSLSSERKYPPILKPHFLPNGWCPLPNSDGDGNAISIPSYPFTVSRTKNKPNDAVGFLPVYSEFRKDGSKTTTRIKRVRGDRGAFLEELRTVLEMPIPKNIKDDTIRIRTGGTIEIKGNRVKEVKHWLASLGF